MKPAIAASLQMGDSATAKGVDTSTYQPINRTQNFNAKDSGAYSWLEFVNIYSPSHNVTWTWLTPQGHLYFRAESTISDPGVGKYYTRYYIYSFISINGSAAAQLPGSWSVVIYTDGNFALFQNFTITDDTPPVQPTEGWSWPTNDIPVSVQDSPPYAYQDVVNSMKQWNYSQAWFLQQYGLQSRPTFRLSLSTSPSAPVQVVFNQTQTSTNWGWTSCHYYYSGDRTFTSVTCSISIVLTRTNGTKLNDIALEDITLHELGHALGLWHVLRPGDLMNHQSANSYDLKCPTTLDLYALYQISTIKQYGVMAAEYALPSSIPYAPSPAFNSNVCTVTPAATSTTSSSSTTTATTSSSTSSTKTSSTSHSSSTSRESTTTTTTVSTMVTTTPEFPYASSVLLLSISIVAALFALARRTASGSSGRMVADS